MIKRGHTELILLMNFLKKRIFAVWIDSRDHNSVACLRDDLGKVISRRSSSEDPPGIKIPAFDKMGKLPQMLLTETFINSKALYEASSQWLHAMRDKVSIVILL
ncbi:hypothetical protein TNCV_815581 [Trichonephila clavipes]|nr:hypothetical protein TNCV_815581 [Trichonephila clavipes]